MSFLEPGSLDDGTWRHYDSKEGARPIQGAPSRPHPRPQRTTPPLSRVPKRLGASSRNEQFPR